MNNAVFMNFYFQSRLLIEIWDFSYRIIKIVLKYYKRQTYYRNKTFPIFPKSPTTFFFTKKKLTGREKYKYFFLKINNQ